MSPHFWQWGEQNIGYFPTLEIKKITYFNIYLRFTVIFTGLIRTTFCHSLHIFRYSEHVQYTEDERKQKSDPPPTSVASRLRRSQLVALNIFISQLSPPPFSLQMTPMHIGKPFHVSFVYSTIIVIQKYCLCIR